MAGSILVNGIYYILQPENKVARKNKFWVLVPWLRNEKTANSNIKLSIGGLSTGYLFHKIVIWGQTKKNEYSSTGVKVA